MLFFKQKMPAVEEFEFGVLEWTAKEDPSLFSVVPARMCGFAK